MASYIFISQDSNDRTLLTDTTYSTYTAYSIGNYLVKYACLYVVSSGDYYTCFASNGSSAVRVYSGNSVAYTDNLVPMGALYSQSSRGIGSYARGIPVYRSQSSLDEARQLALAAMNDGIWEIPGDIAISYIPVNCQLSGPSTANSGDTVTVSVTPNAGHVISLPQQGGSISVYNENGYIPFAWDATNKTITFQAP